MTKLIIKVLFIIISIQFLCSSGYAEEINIPSNLIDKNEKLILIKGNLSFTEGPAVDPAGDSIGIIEINNESVQNCCFGGPEKNILYIAARTAVYSHSTLKAGS